MNDGDTLTVNQGGAVIVGGGGVDAVVDAVDGTTVSVNNRGSILSRGGRGIDVDGSTLIGINSGTITGNDDGVKATTIQRFTNSGIILGSNDGVEATTIQNFTNNGTITGRFDGIFSDTIESFTNNGVIIGTAREAVDVNTIQNFTNSGTIIGDTEGVFSTTIQNFTNSGTITGNNDGVDSETSIQNLTNSGTITGGQDGVDANTTIHNLTNSGTITGRQDGVDSLTTIQNLTNSGTITGGTDGVVANIMQNVTNSGTITGGADGVGALANIDKLTNSGTITGGTEGIDMDFGTVINSGLIQGSTGIEADRGTAGNASVTNSGIIRSTLGPAGVAIDFQGTGDDSLTLLDDHIIVGAINLGAGADTLNYLPGHSSLLTFDSVPEVINSNNPVFTNGTQVAVLDPTAVSLADDISSDLTTNIGIIVSRQASRSGRLQARSSRKVLVASTQLVALPSTEQKKYSSWFEGFGGYKDRNDDGPTLGATTHFAGGMVGIDKLTANDNRFGLFFGGSYSDINVDSNSQELDVYSFYGGIYSGHRFGRNFLDTSLTIGAMNFNSDRSFANNIVPGGLENASADYMGSFINPQITVSRTIPVSKEFSVVPSLRVGYTGLFIESYQEAGSSANLSVGNRDLHLLNSRIQFAFRFDTGIDQPTEGHDNIEGNWNWELFTGLDGRLNLGDEAVDATLIGQTISFDPGGDDEVLRGFGGLNLIYAPTDAITLSARAEAGAGTDKSFYATGKIRATFRF